MRLSREKEPKLKDMKISFFYSDGDEDSVNLTDEEARRELVSFLGRFSDAGKRQWMAKMKDKDYPTPLQDSHYQWIAERTDKEYYN